MFVGYGDGPSIKDYAHQHRSRNKSVNKVNIKGEKTIVGKKEDFFSNEANKQAIIQLIIECLRQRGCEVIQAEGDADVEITKAAIIKSAFRSTTLIGEDC